VQKSLVIILRPVAGWGAMIVALFVLAPVLLPLSGVAAQSGPPPDAGGLSLEEAIRTARENNPDFRIQVAQGETASWREREALGDFLPSANASTSLGYTASGERRFQSVGLGTQPAIYSSSYSVGMSLSMSGATLLRPSLVRDQNRATQARIEGAGFGLEDQVTQAYLAVLQADEELRQARGELERTRLYVRQAEAQVEVGAGTPLDIRRAEIQEGQAEVRLLQTENAAATTRLALGRVMGVPIDVEARLSTSFEVFDPGLDSDELLERALEGNPVLRASRGQANAAGTQFRMARRQYYPSLSLSANWSGSVFEPSDLSPLIADRLGQLANQFESCLQENRIRDLLGDPPRNCTALDPGDPEVASEARAQVRRQNDGFPFGYNAQPLSFSLSFSIPVFTGFSRQLQIEEARVAVSTAREQVRSEELRLRAEVESQVRTVETARRSVALQTRIRETATEELRLAQERFRLGLASSIEAVDAQGNLSQAERDEISAIYSFHISLAGLEALVGERLRTP